MSYIGQSVLGYYSYDQPVLCGPFARPYADRVRYVGDRVAAVVAENEEIAAAAAAVHSATGVWFDEFPLTPKRVLRGHGKL